MIRRRESPEDDSGSPGARRPTFVPMTTSSRWPAMALPSSSSKWPPLYVTAVSKYVMPADIA